MITGQDSTSLRRLEEENRRIPSRPMTVYLASFANGKHYVGITSETLEKRQSRHMREAEKGSRNKFHCALRKREATWSVIGTACCRGVRKTAFGFQWKYKDVNQ